MPLDPNTSSASNGAAPARPAHVAAELEQRRRETDWETAHREWLPYWQKGDPVPPVPENTPGIETPGEVLTERQEAFCRAYVEQPVAAKAAVAAGYSPANARQQANRLLKHPLVVRRVHALREASGMDRQVRRDTIVDQAEAVYEAAMEKGEFYAAMQALTIKARLAGFADYLPGVRILRRDPRDFEQEFWARSHAAEQRIMALRLGEIAAAPLERASATDDGAGGGADARAGAAASAEAAARAESAREGQRDAEMFAQGAEKVARHFGMRAYDAIERLRNRR